MIKYRQRRATRHVVFAAVLALPAAGCRPAQTAAPARPALRVSLAIPPLGGSMAEEFRRTLPQYDIQTVAPASFSSPTSTPGAIARGLVDWGVERSDIAYRSHAAQASRGDAGRQSRGVALLHPLPMYVLVRPNSGINRVQDLRGRRIAVGPLNTSSDVLAKAVLRQLGVPDAPVVNLPAREPAAAGLRAGTLDAAFFPGYVYPDDVVLQAIKAGAYLLPIEGTIVDALQRDNPFIRTVTIPRNIYPGQDRLIPTIGIELVVICAADLDEQLVYEVTRQLFEVYPSLSRLEATLRFLNLNNAPATPIPLHPGASRYYRELQLSQ
jgi:TRAP transporter TAXI family solute receptor